MVSISKVEKPYRLHPEQSENLFQRLETNPSPLEGLLLQEISPASIVDFVRGCREILQQIKALKPSMLFFPARGGLVLQAAIEELAQHDNFDLPPSKILLIGNSASVESRRLFSPKKRDKRTTVSITSQTSFEPWPENLESVMLIDEKSAGNSAIYAATLVRDEILKRHYRDHAKKIIYVVGFEYKSSSTDKFTTLSKNQSNLMQGSVVKAENPFVDNKLFLDTIIDPPNLPQELRNQMPGMRMLIRNVEARKLIQMLTYAVEYPEVLARTLSFVESLPDSRLEDPFFQWLDHNLNNLGSDVSRNSVLHWFHELLNEIS